MTGTGSLYKKGASMKITQNQTREESRARIRRAALQALYRLGKITAAECNYKTLANIARDVARDVADGRGAKQ